MPLPALATTTDLAAVMQRDFSEQDTYTATLALNHASDLIRSYLGQTVTLIENDTARLQVGAGGRIALPQRPVVDVSAVVIASTPVAWEDGPNLVTVNARWQGFTAAVTYSHGYPAGDIPGEIIGICLEVAKRRLTNPSDLNQVGAISFSRPAGSGLMLTPDEQATLQRCPLGRPRLYSVNLG